MATINIVFDRVGKVDPVTRGIEIAVKYMGFQFDVSIKSVWDILYFLNRGLGYYLTYNGMMRSCYCLTECQHFVFIISGTLSYVQLLFDTV